jgi:hypothetical protein
LRVKTCNGVIPAGAELLSEAIANERLHPEPSCKLT